MKTIAKTTARSVLFALIVACVVTGLWLMGASLPVAASAGAVVGALIKLDDARIRRARRKAEADHRAHFGWDAVEEAATWERDNPIPA